MDYFMDMASYTARMEISFTLGISEMGSEMVKGKNIQMRLVFYMLVVSKMIREMDMANCFILLVIFMKEILIME